MRRSSLMVAVLLLALLAGSLSAAAQGSLAIVFDVGGRGDQKQECGKRGQGPAGPSTRPISHSNLLNHHRPVTPLIANERAKARAVPVCFCPARDPGPRRRLSTRMTGRN